MAKICFCNRPYMFISPIFSRSFSSMFLTSIQEWRSAPVFFPLYLILEIFLQIETSSFEYTHAWISLCVFTNYEVLGYSCHHLFCFWNYCVHIDQHFDQVPFSLFEFRTKCFGHVNQSMRCWTK